MRSPLKVPLALAEAAALASSGSFACPNGGPPSAGLPVADTDLVFKMQDFNGYAPLGAPQPFPLALYGDGTLIYVQTNPYIQSRETQLPRLQVRKLTPAGVQLVLQGAIDAGLTTTTDYGDAGMDAGATRFTVVNKGKMHSVRVEGADFPLEVRGNPITVLRDELVRFRKHLKDLDFWLGAEVSPPAPHTYRAMAVISQPTGDIEFPERFPAPMDWPFEDLAAGPRCQVMTGDRLGQAAQLAAEAHAYDFNAYGAWRSNTKLYFLQFRPLLPDEKDCQSISLQ